MSYLDRRSQATVQFSGELLTKDDMERMDRRIGEAFWGLVIVAALQTIFLFTAIVLLVHHLRCQ